MPFQPISQNGVKMGNSLDATCPDVPKTLGGLFYELGRRGVALRADGDHLRFTSRGSSDEVGEELVALIRRNKVRILAAFQESLE